ncbi:MAG: LysM peptidoglycan-binding domain-containing protein [Bacilli bacterium]|nr:LysM peptidoglycan-binding domain-containing protein [Bacilli bacterium]
MYSIYQVQNGETLASIANKFGMTANDLASLNGIMMGTVLNKGDYIIVPKMESENLYFDKYMIQKGDTIYSIAQRYEISPSHLLRLNGLNTGDIIYPGEMIFIPKEGVSFYITSNDDTLNDLISFFGVNVSDIANQNRTIYLANDQLIVYRK